MCNKFWLVFLGLLIFFPLSAGAEESNSSQMLSTQMEEMVVTAGRVKEMRKEVTTNITVINEKEIRLSPARDLGELLAEQNMGYLLKYPGALSGVGLRSYKTDSHGNDLAGSVLILVDGRRTGTGNSAKIMTDNIEKIEILHGPASVQYGSAAMGGLVNVITKRGKEKPSAYVQGKLGSFGYEEGSFGFSGKYENFDFSGSASRSSVDDYKTGSGEKYENTGIDEENDISLNLGYEFLPKNRIGLIYNLFDANGIGDPGTLAPGYYKDLDDYDDKKLETFDFMYEGATADEIFSWKARYFTAEDKNTYYAVNSTSTLIDRETTTDPQGAQAQVTWNPRNYRLTAGFDWVNYDIKSTGQPQKAEYDNPSYFLLGKANYFNDQLILSAGMRYDQYDFEAKNENIKSDDSNLSPQVGIAYLPIENLKLRANYGEGFRMPSSSELALDYSGSMGNYKGNPSLKPEKSHTYAVGFDFFYKAFDSSLTFFYSEYKDKIESVQVNATENTYHNIGEATISGFEGEFSYDIAPLFNWSWQIQPFLNFVYLTEYKNEDTGRDLTKTSKYQGACGLKVSDFSGFSANFNLTYTDHLEDHGGDKLPGFAVANLSLEKRLMDWGNYGGLTLRGEVKNLFDRDYAYKYGYPMPGRNFALGLRYDF